MFYLQVKDAILSDEIYCPPETTVLIASYACQAKFGDYNNDIHEPGFLSNDRTLPDRSISFSLYIKTRLKKHENWFSRPIIDYCRSKVVQNAPTEAFCNTSTFITLPFFIKIFVLSIFEWSFYTGFTVVNNSM